MANALASWGTVRDPAMRRGGACERGGMRPSVRRRPVTVLGKTTGRLGARSPCWGSCRALAAALVPAAHRPRICGALSGAPGRAGRAPAATGPARVVGAWALTRGGLRAEPLERLRVGGREALGLLLPRGQGLGRDIACHGRAGRAKRLHDPGIDRIGRYILTHRGPIRWAEVVTEGA